MWLQFFIYVSFSTFIFVSVLKTIQYAKMPIHLRWELYPVAHANNQGNGGSYLENLDWWARPRRKSILGEIRYIARELLLFEKCYRNNRGLWYFTYSFHTGLFLLIGWLILLFIGATVMPANMNIAQSGSLWLRSIHYLTVGAGLGGFGLSTFGCAGLLARRLTNEGLKSYATPLDYFNLLFILADLLSGLASWYFYDPAFINAREFMKSLITFTAMPSINLAMTISIILFSLLLVYMPFTKMMHGLAKYFTYHRVSWDDEPNLRGSDIGKEVEKLLNQSVNWSASHIQHGKRWNEVVAEKRKVEKEK